MGATRRYRPGTLILETEFQTGTGSAAVVDFMQPSDGAHLLRIVIGRSGRVDFQTELVVRFNYGATVPWVNRLSDGSINAIAGPEHHILQGRYPEARKLFDRLLSRCNDVGLLAKEFDPLSGRMLGNFPQAYSHVGVINCALNLSRQRGPAEERAE